MMAFLYVVPERIDVQSFCRPRPAAFWQIVFGVTSSIIIFWLKKLKNYIGNRQTNILQSVKFEDKIKELIHVTTKVNFVKIMMINM